MKKIFVRLRDIFIEIYLKKLPEKKKFETIYKFSYWRSRKDESLSGYGSSYQATKNLRKELQNFILNENILSLFDVPCGDFFWLQKLDLKNVKYLGGDIVGDMINKNNLNYKKSNINFIEFDILREIPDEYDLILTRDCLVHFKDNNVLKALSNFAQSKSKYFATTTYPKIDRNVKSNLPDNWRPINLCLEPFNLPKPYILLNDKEVANSEVSNSSKEKYIGVWKIEDLKNLSFN